MFRRDLVADRDVAGVDDGETSIDETLRQVLFLVKKEQLGIEPADFLEGGPPQRCAGADKFPLLKTLAPPFRGVSRAVNPAGQVGRRDAVRPVETFNGEGKRANFRLRAKALDGSTDAVRAREYGVIVQDNDRFSASGRRSLVSPAGHADVSRVGDQPDLGKLAAVIRQAGQSLGDAALIDDDNAEIHAVLVERAPDSIKRVVDTTPGQYDDVGVGHETGKSEAHSGRAHQLDRRVFQQMLRHPSLSLIMSLIKWLWSACCLQPNAGLRETARTEVGMPTTTVIIPTFNRAHLLRATLDAVLSQTRPPSEIIVVDDGSTDSTQELIRSCGVRVLHTPNRGKSAAVNLGLSHATGDWIWIVDDDDVPCPDALQRLQNLLRIKPRARFAYGRHERFKAADGAMRRLGTGYWSDCLDEEFHLATMEDYFAHQPGMLVAREVYETVGPFDETLSASEDYEMLVRTACRFDGVRCDGIVFWQRLHDGDRGPTADRFGAAEREARWIEADKQIFLRFRQSLPQGAYLPRGAFFPEDVGRRRALFQRGCIMARKKLWTEAIADFSHAAIIDCGPLSPDERSIVTRATFSKYGCDELIASPSIVHLLSDMGRQRRLGSDVASAIARGLVWRIRKAALAGQPVHAGRLLRAVARLASPIGAHWGALNPSRAHGHSADSDNRN